MADFDGYRVFDDTLTAGDGLLEAGLLVPLDEVQSRFEVWLRKRHKLEGGRGADGGGIIVGHMVATVTSWSVSKWR